MAHLVRFMRPVTFKGMSYAVGQTVVPAEFGLTDDDLRALGPKRVEPVEPVEPIESKLADILGVEPAVEPVEPVEQVAELNPQPSQQRQKKKK